jgi:hypothetical protein
MFCRFYNNSLEVSIDQFLRKFRGISWLMEPFPGCGIPANALLKRRIQTGILSKRLIQVTRRQKYALFFLFLVRSPVHCLTL